MVSRWVYVQNDTHGNVLGIYKGYPNPVDCFSMMERGVAVSAIRKQVFARSKGYCEYCGANLGEGGHMHETVSRGRGGLISLTNCVAICAECHRKEHPGIGGRT